MRLGSEWVGLVLGPLVALILAVSLLKWACEAEEDVRWW